ncbi:RNA polymerase sigma factor [Paenibacillus pinisoli]|uniref:RNA polymerase sigma factor n=2 Tax=Paenibacillus pinisoli TaxID=1276110 RepID=A0A3A6PQV4_9BACL|nr:RNA polymerase sigma factor [Paenibacillus pinisoli]
MLSNRTDISKRCKPAMLDENVFRDAYANYKTDITRYLVKITENLHDAEDLAQECYIRLLKTANSVPEENLFLYLRVIARNLAIDSLRKGMRTKVKLQQAELKVQHNDVYELEVLEGIEEIVSLVVNRAHRQILELRLLHGYSIKETATLVNKSESLVRMSLFHAVKRIRSHSGWYRNRMGLANRRLHQPIKRPIVEQR